MCVGEHFPVLHGEVPWNAAWDIIVHDCIDAANRGGILAGVRERLLACQSGIAQQGAPGTISVSIQIG